jgi:hypothetical protein
MRNFLISSLIKPGLAVAQILPADQHITLQGVKIVEHINES